MVIRLDCLSILYVPLIDCPVALLAVSMLTKIKDSSGLLKSQCYLSLQKRDSGTIISAVLVILLFRMHLKHSVHQ